MDEQKKWTDYYYRIIKGQDPKVLYKRLQQGYGMKHPERVNGFSGLLAGTGNVFVSKSVLAGMDSTDLRKFVYDALACFWKEKYGDISSSDIEENGENRWIDAWSNLLGRYGYYIDGNWLGKDRYDRVIRIKEWEGNTWIAYDAEPEWFMRFRKEDLQAGDENEALTREEGPAFLLEYRKHPGRYLALTGRQYQNSACTGPGNFWSAGLLEDNRPYFAEYKGFYLYILTSARWVKKETAENTFLQKLIARGLVTDRRKDPPSLWPFLFERTEPDGDRYWVLRIEGEKVTPNGPVRWTGPRHSFTELNRLNPEE